MIQAGCWGWGPAWMTRPLSKDLRERIVEAVESGASRQATAKRFAVSASSVIRLMQRWRRTGSVAPDQVGGWKDHSLAEHEVVVRELVAAIPDRTLDELRDALAEKGIHVGRSSVGRFLAARGLTLKKRRSTPGSSSGRMSLPRARPGVSVSRR
jgi:transposase